MKQEAKREPAVKQVFKAEPDADGQEKTTDEIVAEKRRFEATDGRDSSRGAILIK